MIARLLLGIVCVVTAACGQVQPVARDAAPTGDAELDAPLDDAPPACPDGCSNLEVCEGSCVCSAALCRGGYANWPMPGTPGRPRDYETRTGSVLDRVTGLEWQLDISASTFTWAGAQSHCAALALSGKTDWRAPSRIELVSILDFTRPSIPRIDHAAFPGAPAVEQWTASPVDAERGWSVSFDEGSPTPNDLARTSPRRVRCVRTAIHRPSVPAQLINHGDGTVTDAGTRLMWRESTVTQTLENAAAYCAGLDFAGHADWQLPTAAEVMTLVDEARVNPALDPTAFPGTQSAGYYATTTLVSGSTTAGWSVHFYFGEGFQRGLTEGASVRCVRRLPL